MFIVCGLGNPGQKYEDTRHNAGVWVVRELERVCDTVSAPSWKSKDHAQQLSCRLFGEKALLLIPEVYMNLSGEAVAPAVSFYKIDPAKQLIIIHDELAIEPGSIRIKSGGSAGGHNGLEDVIARLGNPDFIRIRVGIGDPSRISADPTVEQRLEKARGSKSRSDLVSNWVLGRPSVSEQELLEDGVLQAREAVSVLFTEGLEAAQRRFNRRERSAAP